MGAYASAGLGANSMPSKLRFAWLRGANEWRVSDEHGRLLGTITETSHGYEAKGRWVIRTKLFGSREAAALWLEEVAAD